MAVYKSKNPTKDGRCWYFSVWKKDIDGTNKKYQSKLYATKKEATDGEVAFRIHKDLPSSKSFYSVSLAYLDYCKLAKKESTAFDEENILNRHLYPVFGSLELNSITVGHINRWKDSMFEKGYKKAYLHKIYNTLSQVFNYGIKNCGLETNVATIAGNFKIVNEVVTSDEEKLRYITLDQFNEFISNVDDPMWHCVFVTLFYSGMRKGELQALQVKDIDFKNKVIIVNKNLTVKTKSGYKITTTKNYINRKVAMSSFLYNELYNYVTHLRTFTDFSDSWFLFGGPRFLPQTTMDRYKKHYFSLSSVPEITYHEFRHSHVSMLINEYIKSGQTDTAKFFLMMSSRMGHSIEVMQSTYMHLFPSVQNEIVDLLDNL